MIARHRFGRLAVTGGNDLITKGLRSDDGPDAELSERRLARWMCDQAIGDDVLDFRCGRGTRAVLLAGEGKRVVGVADDPDALEYARRRLDGEDPAVRGRVQLLTAEAGELPVDADSFDVVLLGDVLECMSDRGRVLAEAMRACRSGGRVVAGVPYGCTAAPDLADVPTLGWLLETLADGLKPVVLELVDHRFLGLVAVAGERGIETWVWRRALDLAEERLRDLNSTVEDLSNSVERQAEAVREQKKRAGKLEEELIGVREGCRAKVGPRRRLRQWLGESRRRARRALR